MLRRYLVQLLPGVLLLVVGMLLVTLGAHWALYLVLPALLWIALLGVNRGPL